MGRKGKAKKLTVSSHEDMGSAEEEKLPTQKRRGRPQKQFKDEIVDDDVTKTEDEDEDSENKDSSITTALDNAKKRRRNSPTKEKQTSAKEESTLVADKPTGFRHIGSRRKNKPRRAAEVGVECW